MAKDTITLSVNGDLPLDAFAEAVAQLHKLVKARTREVGGRAEVVWRLENLEYGSADISLQGVSDVADLVPRITQAYAVVGQSLAASKPIPYSQSVVKPAQALAAIVGDEVTSLEFRAGEATAEVFAPTSMRGALLVGAFGAVTGQVETLTMRRGYKFILYDDVFDHPVQCYLGVDQDDLMRNAWGRPVTVSGWVERNSSSGVPVKITQISAVEIAPETTHGEFRRARGVLPRQPGDLLPEEVIRIIRDA